MTKLNDVERMVIELCPYDESGAHLFGEYQKVARRLVKRGLLEENPTAVNRFRVTRKGDDLRHDICRGAK